MLEARELEELVVGCCLVHATAYHRIGSWLLPSMFAERWARDAYGAIAELAATNAHINLATVARRLDGTGEDVRPRLIIAADKAKDDVQHLADYADGVLDAFRRRKMSALAAELAKKAADPNATLAVTIEEVSSHLSAMIAADRGGEHTLDELVRGVVERVEAAADGQAEPGMLTGIASLDDVTGPWQESEFVVLGGPSGSGKTHLATQIACHVAMDKPVLFVAQDQMPADIAARLVAQWADLPLRGIRDGALDAAQRDRLAGAKARARAHRITFVRRPRISVEEIRARALAMAKTGGLGLIVIDHLKRVYLRRKVGNEFERYAEVVGELRELTQEARAPVLLLSQMTRESQRDEDPTPRRWGLYGGGAIDEIADMVLMVWRPERSDAWNRRCKDEGDLDHQSRTLHARGKVEIICDKHRWLPEGGRVRLAFDGPAAPLREIE